MSLRNRDLESFLRSKCIEKYLFGKLRVRAFHRLKNQPLRTSPSKVMAISKILKIHKIKQNITKFIRILKIVPWTFPPEKLSRAWLVLILHSRLLPKGVKNIENRRSSLRAIDSAKEKNKVNKQIQNTYFSQKTFLAPAARSGFSRSTPCLDFSTTW